MRYEVEIVHPAVAQWLIDNDYTYRCEVYMPDFGRADFIATHDDGHVLIVECKANGQGLSRAITQVSDYRNQYDPSARIAIALPGYCLNNKVSEICTRRGAHLITVDVPLKSEVSDTRPPVFVQIWGTFTDLAIDAFYAPDKTINSILDKHSDWSRQLVDEIELARAGAIAFCSTIRAHGQSYQVACGPYDDILRMLRSAGNLP